MSGRYEEACCLADQAEALVRACEAGVAAARNATARDIAETRLQEALVMQDEALELVAPAIEARRREVVQAGWEAIKSLRGDPGADWCAKHRQVMTRAVKSWLIERLGRKVYERAFPW